MSRYYRMEVDIKPVEPEERDGLRDQLSAAGLEDIDGTDIDAAYCFYGHMSLGGGRSPEEQHEEFKRLFPGKQVASRWLNLDEQPWDIEIDFEEDNGT